MKISKVLIALGFLASNLVPHSSHAAGAYIYIDNMSNLKYQMLSDGRVYFRNLNAFKDDVTGCCYAFYLDTTTEYGKSAWSVMLMKIATAGSLYMKVNETNPPPSGNPVMVSQIGEW